MPPPKFCGWAMTVCPPPVEVFPWVSLTVEPVWKEPFREGVLFYLRDDVIRGVLLWNVWERVEWARELVREGRAMSAGERADLVASLA